MKWLRVLKAIGSTALAWGAVWSLLSIPTLWALLNSAPPGPAAWQPPWSAAAFAWLYAFAHGAVIGTGFAVALHFAAKWIPAMRQLSVIRLGLLGGVVAGVSGLLVIGPAIGLTGGLVLAGLGASTAVASLLVARRARDRTLVNPTSTRRLPST